MDITIIKPLEKHLEQMVKLTDESRQYHNEILNGYFKEDASAAELDVIKQHMLEDKDHIIFIATDKDDNVLGMIYGGISYKPWLEKSKIGRVSVLVVSKQARRNGIGKKLMDAFVTECKNRGMQEVRLGVYNKNKSAYDFYVNYGFESLKQDMNIIL